MKNQTRRIRRALMGALVLVAVAVLLPSTGALVKTHGSAPTTPPVQFDPCSSGAAWVYTPEAAARTSAQECEGNPSGLICKELCFNGMPGGTFECDDTYQCVPTDDF